MFIKIPVLLAQETGVEDIQGKPHESIARVNPEHIELYHYFTDTQIIVFTIGGGELVVNLTLEEFDALLDTHEITIYEN